MYLRSIKLFILLVMSQEYKEGYIFISFFLLIKYVDNHEIKDLIKIINFLSKHLSKEK